MRVLGIDRSYYYYRPKQKPINQVLTQTVIDTFNASRKNYGTRKLKHELARQGLVASRRLIGNIMHKHGLVSNYTKPKYKTHNPTGTNEAAVPNLLNRDFNRQITLDVVVSDLTYVRVGENWCYVCLMIDLWNREIIGWSVGRHKDATLVRQALLSIPYNLMHINFFHTDRGREFDNKAIDEALQAFEIKRSLSQKGCPFDNAVNESTNKILKTEFIYQHKFHSLAELRTLLFDYIHWYNHIRIHSSLNYQTPIGVRNSAQASTSLTPLVYVKELL